MKKLNLLFTALLLMCCVGTAKAHDFEFDGIYYNITSSYSKTAEVTYKGSSYDSYLNEYTGCVVIPERVTYNGKIYSVTSIGYEAFYYCSRLTSITIPNSVTSIGNYAFYYCSGLTSITIPNSVTSIGNSAFGGCSGLTSITIPNSVTSIGNSAFDGCTGLTSITIPNSVTSIGNYAFDGCTGLESIVVEKGNTKYDSRDNCNAIIETESNTLIAGCKNSVIPNSVTSIGNYAFRECSDLTSITIPNSVTRIEYGAFWGCDGLESIVVDPGNTKYDSRDNCNAIIETESNTLIAGCKNTVIPNSVTSIGSTAFTGCSGLTSVTIPDGVTSIGWNAFAGCSGLTSITIPNSVTSIGNSAFEGCTGLTSITIPNSVTRIGEYVFSYCSNLTDVYSLATNVPATSSDAFYNLYPENMTLHVPAEAINSYKTTAPWSSFGSFDEFVGGEMVIDGIKYDINVNTKQATVISGGNYSGDIVIPSEITYNNVTYSVTSIGSYAFLYCSGLTSITIPNSVTSIGDYAFDGCSGLTSITIPNSVTSIGDWAFYECSGLTSITIPNSVTSIGNNAFYGCSGLESIVVDPGNTKYDSRDNCNAIIETESNTLIIGCKDTVIPNSVTSIGGVAFSGCKGLTSITIPNSVTSIGTSAFNQCSGLTSVTFGNNVTSIGNYAFWVCTGLTSITIPNSVTSIGDAAFEDCSGLTSVTIGNSVTSIGWCAFADCDGLTSITIPNSVTSIESGAFADCDGLESIVVDADNTKYDSRENCNAIIETESNTLIKGCKNTVIPNSVTSIGNSAFDDCDGLTSITIPNSVKSIGRYAFSWCSGLTSITIPNSVTSLGEWAFDGCSNLTDVYCLATNVPSTNWNAFSSSYIKNMKLHVPAEAINSYKTTEPWSSFGNIVAIIVEKPKCDNPVISYYNRELVIECETENAEFVTEVTSNDFNKFYSDKITFSATYNISVYATATGYDNSDTVNATLCWIECDCSADDNTDIINIPAKAVFVTSNNGTINISCSLEGEVVELYTIDAMYIGSTTIENGCATIESGLSKGDIAIIKIAEKSIKVILN